MQKALISIKGVHLISWQDINPTVLFVQEIVDHNICTSFTQICNRVSNSTFPHFINNLLLKMGSAQRISYEVRVPRDALFSEMKGELAMVIYN